MKQQLDRWLGNFLAVLLAAMVLVVLWGVFTRYVLANSAGWTDELARFLLVWVAILGASYVTGRRAHLSINLLESKLSARAQRRLQRGITLLVALFVTSVLIIGGGRLVYLTHHLGQTSAALRLPMWIVYAVLPLSGTIILIYQALELSTPKEHQPTAL